MTRKAYLFLPALTLAGFAASLPAQTPPGGEALFRQRCASCHTVTPGGKATLGPNLAGISGRKSAATAYNYSPAFKAANVTWDRANLDRYLAGPTRMVPGSRMVIMVSNPEQRAAIVDYMMKL